MLEELFSLAGRVALVTGGNGGLGRAMALGLRAAGARVAVTGRDSRKNMQVAAELGSDGAVLTLDVRSEDAVAAAVVDVLERFGRLDILVNNAGVALSNGSVTNMPRADWDMVIETNMTGAFLCAKHAGRAMISAGHGGKILNIASIYARYGAPDFAHYSSAKAGLVGLTRALAVELAPHNIQVNAILPGWFQTAMTGDMPVTELGEQIRRKTPAGRWGEPTDLVGATVFLASRASDFVTGAELAVDGGYLVADRFREP
jgi:2-dehydro-3-deoxy-D-gluconate 5-dehydrogenase